MPRDIAADCTAYVTFLDPATFPATERQLLRIEAHWVGQPEPRDYYDIPKITKRNVGFREEMIDVLRRRPNDGTAYAADPWIVYSPPWDDRIRKRISASDLADLEAEWEKRRLQQRIYIVRVEIEPANGWSLKRYFRLTLPEAGMGTVVWDHRTDG